MLLALPSITGTLRAADVSLYEVRKGIRYGQTNSSGPAELFNNYVFSADVYPVVTNWVRGASVESPGTYAFLPLGFTGSDYQWQSTKNALGALDAAYANGVYLLKINAVHDGSRQFSLPLRYSLYPRAPRISNFQLMRSLYATGYCLVTWDRFVSGTAADLIRLTIQDATGRQYYQTPNSTEEAALNGTATWALLEPGRLKTNHTYTAKLLFQRNVTLNRASYPGALGLAAYYVETEFSLHTAVKSGPDVKVIELSKTLRWAQAGDTSPVPEPHVAQFSVSAKSYQTSVLASATLLLPPGSQLSSTNLLLQPDLLTLRFSETARTAADLDARYGTGSYTLNLPTPHDGAKSLVFNLQSVTNAPQTPQVLGFSSLQNIRAFKPATISWLSWTNGAVSDFIQLTINDSVGAKVFATPDLGGPNALHGLATNAVVPAGILQSGQANGVQLVFRRNASLDTTNYPGVLSMADYRSETSFSIQTAPADVASYEIIKGQTFRQSGAGLPLPLPTDAYFFSAQVRAFASNSISSASLITAGGTNQVLNAVPGGALWAFTNRASTQTAVNSAYPASNYTFRVTCANDGVQNLSVSLPGAFPPAPHLINYPGQLLDASASFSLEWDPFTLTDTNTFIQLRIIDSAGHVAFATPDFGAPGALSGASLSAVIPAGFLNFNQFYEGSLLFETYQPTNSPTYRQPTGRGAVASVTWFSLGTLGPGNPPVLNITWNPANELLQLTAAVVSNQGYRIDYCTNLPPQWIPLFTNSSSSNLLWFSDPGAPRRPQTFYRIVTWP